MKKLIYRWRNRKHATWLYVQCHDEWWFELMFPPRTRSISDEARQVAFAEMKRRYHT